ncbi:putative Adenylate cyclase [Blattamonas nauphoetae]|uniref:Adenylate cyclase n=1 Tax=Blattamonas nauphoetae TaxID=2049346 RepID=A0ABQ9X6L8_9EUKA|nr:putative Adenylate cyclase [Blattamonas nauphoetae]
MIKQALSLVLHHPISHMRLTNLFNNTQTYDDVQTVQSITPEKHLDLSLFLAQWQFLITITDQNDRTDTIGIDSLESIQEMKARYAHMRQITPERITLSFRGEQLDESSQFSAVDPTISYSVTPASGVLMGGAESQDLSGKNVSFSRQHISAFPLDILSKERPWINHLNLSNNLLEDLPRILHVLPNLRTLQLNMNCFTSFPSSLNMSPSLARMDISNNTLTEFQHIIIPHLEDLRMNHTKMRIFPHLMKQVFPALHQLEMTSGELREFPVLEHDTLTLLDLQSNALERVSVQLNLPLLKSLNLAVNSMRIFELDPLSKLSLLTTLELRINDLKEISEATFSCMPKLTKLKLTHNKLDSLPDNLFDICPNLNLVWIGENNVSSIPSSTSRLRDCDSFLCSHNFITALPTLSTVYSETGTQFNFSDNLLTTVPILSLDTVCFTADNNAIVSMEGFVNINQQEDGANQTSLDIDEPRNRKSEEAPSHQDSAADDDVLCNLSVLSLSHNQLTEFPMPFQAESAVRNVIPLSTSLISLNFVNNRIRTIPDTLSTFSLLTSLNLSFNSILVIPEVLSSLRSLKTLNLAFNQISVVPPFIFRLPSLSELNLSCNFIQSLPTFEEITVDHESVATTGQVLPKVRSTRVLGEIPLPSFTLSPLTSLNLNMNLFESFPSIIPSFSLLHTIYMSHNNLTCLPASLFVSLPSISRIDLSFNCLSSLPPFPSFIPTSTRFFLDVSHNNLPEFPPFLIHSHPSLYTQTLSDTRTTFLKEQPVFVPPLPPASIDNETEPDEADKVTLSPEHPIGLSLPLSKALRLSSLTVSEEDDPPIVTTDENNEPLVHSPHTPRYVLPPDTTVLFNPLDVTQPITDPKRPYDELASPSVAKTGSGDSESSPKDNFADAGTPKQWNTSQAFNFVDVSFNPVGEMRWMEQMDEFIKSAEADSDSSSNPKESELLALFTRTFQRIRSSSNAQKELLLDDQTVPHSEIAELIDNEADISPIDSSPITSSSPTDESPMLISTDDEQFCREMEDALDNDTFLSLQPQIIKSRNRTALTLQLSSLMPHHLTHRFESVPFPAYLPHFINSSSYLTHSFLTLSSSSQAFVTPLSPGTFRPPNPTSTIHSLPSSLCTLSSPPFWCYSSVILFDNELRRRRTEKKREAERRQIRPRSVFVSEVEIGHGVKETDLKKEEREKRKRRKETEERKYYESFDSFKHIGDKRTPASHQIEKTPVRDVQCSLCYPPFPESTKDDSSSEDEEDEEKAEKEEEQEQDQSQVTTTPVPVRGGFDDRLGNASTLGLLPFAPLEKKQTSTNSVSPLGSTITNRFGKTTSPFSLSLAVFPVGVAETCGSRPSMEDALLLAPIDGWDLDGLVCDSEWDTIERLLTLPNELRLTQTGMEAMTEREVLLNPSAHTKHFHPKMHSCGLFGVFDGHKGPTTSHFISSEFVHTFIATGKKLTAKLRQRERQTQTLLTFTFRDKPKEFVPGTHRPQSMTIAHTPTQKQKNASPTTFTRDPHPIQQTHLPTPPPPIHAANLKNGEAGEDVDKTRSINGKPTPPEPFTVAQKSKDERSSCVNLNQILAETVRVLNEEIRHNKLDDGSCLCVCAITKDAIKCVNVGDSRAVLVSEFPFEIERQVFQSGKGVGKLTVPLLKEHPSLKPLLHPLLLPRPFNTAPTFLALPLSFDHKPVNAEEMAQIRSRGGWVSLDRRVNGKLATARSLGDIELQPEVSGEPDVFERSRTNTEPTQTGQVAADVLLSCWTAYLNSLTPHPLRPTLITPPKDTDSLSNANPPKTTPGESSSLTGLDLQNTTSPRLSIPPSAAAKVPSTPVPVIPPKPRSTSPSAAGTEEKDKATKPTVEPVHDQTHSHNSAMSNASLFGFSAPHALQTDCAVVIACDGVFDVLSSQHIADIIHLVLLHFTRPSAPSSNPFETATSPLVSRLTPAEKGHVAQKCAVAIKTAALALNTQDNLSVIVVLL